jgi:hypothetical protein
MLLSPCPAQAEKFKKIHGLDSLDFVSVASRSFLFSTAKVLLKLIFSKLCIHYRK